MPELIITYNNKNTTLYFSKYPPIDSKYCDYSSDSDSDENINSNILYENKKWNNDSITFDYFDFKKCIISKDDFLILINLLLEYNRYNNNIQVYEHKWNNLIDELKSMLYIKKNNILKKLLNIDMNFNEIIYYDIINNLIDYQKNIKEYYDIKTNKYYQEIDIKYKDEYKPTYENYINQKLLKWINNNKSQIVIKFIKKINQKLYTKYDIYDIYKIDINEYINKLINLKYNKLSFDDIKQINISNIK